MTVPPNEPPRPPSDPTPPPGYATPPGYGPPPMSGQPPAYGPPPLSGTPQGYGPPPGYGQQRPEDTLWSVLAHLSVFVVALLGPLVVYLVFKDSSPFIRHHAAEALNFHLTLLLATIVSGVLVIVLIGFVLLLAVFAWAAVFAIVAAVAAGNRELYRYPLTIRFVS